MKSLKLFFFVIAFFSQSILFSQTNIDSLQIILKSTKQDTTKLNIYAELFSYYTFKNMDSTTYYLELAKELQKTNNIKKVEGRIYQTEGNLAWWQGNLELARNYYTKSILIWEELNNLSKIANMYLNISLSFQYEMDSALLYLNKSKEYSLLANDSISYISTRSREGELLTRQGKYDECIIIYQEILSYAKRNNDTKYEYYAYHGLGLIDFRIENYKKALEYYTKEYKIAKLRDIIYEIHNACNGLALTYYKLGDIEESEKYHFESLTLAREIGNPRMLAIDLSNIYEQLTAEGRHLEAAPYVKEALELAKEYNISDLFMSLYINSGKSEMYKKQYHLAKELVRKGINIAYASKSFPWLIYGYDALVKIDSARGDYKSALTFKDSLIAFNDSIKNKEIKEKIEELNIKYETQQKEQENVILKQEQIANQLELRNRNIIIIAVSIFGILALILILVILINRRKLKERNFEILNKKDEIQAQSEELSLSLERITELTKFKGEITQMLVHDLKNPLNILLNIPQNISSDEKTEIRKSSSSDMLNLVMNILDVKKYEEAELILNKTETNLFQIWENVLNQQDYSIRQKNISIFKKTNNIITSSADANLLERVFTNILTNAIKYTPPQGNIKFVTENLENNTVKIKICNTGAGIPESELSTVFDKYRQSGSKIKYSTGLGLTFCKIVVEKHGGEIGIESNKDKGTTVWFTLPNTAIAENNTETEIIETNTEIVLTDTEKADLLEIIHQLKQIDISEISAFRKIFREIENKQLGNKTWREALKKSVYSSNEDFFNKLINLDKLN